MCVGLCVAHRRWLKLCVYVYKAFSCWSVSGAVQSAEISTAGLRTVEGGDLEFSKYILDTVLVASKHHYFIQQLPPNDQYYNPQSRQSHHHASYFPVQLGAHRGFHLNHISSFF